MLAVAAHLQDVYTAIAIRVRQKMQDDADNGHPLAARLVDAVDRKLVKQVGRQVLLFPVLRMQFSTLSSRLAVSRARGHQVLASNPDRLT